MTPDPSSDISSPQKRAIHRRQPKISNHLCSPAQGNTSTMGTVLAANTTPIPGPPSVYQHTSHGKDREIASVSGSHTYSEHRQSRPDAETISQGLPSSVTAFGVATTKIIDDNQCQNNNSTEQQSPLPTALPQMNDICGDVIQQCTTVHQSPEQAVHDPMIEAPPVSNSTQPPLSTKKSWIFRACRKCIEAKHLIYHQKMFGTLYRGKAHNCKHKECRRMLSALWHTNFVRSDDCCHSGEAVPSKETSHLSESVAHYDKRRQTQNCSTLSQNKVSKRKHNATRTSRGRFTKRTEPQSNSGMTEQFAHSDESTGALHMPSGAFEFRPAEVHEDRVSVSAGMLRRLSIFNMEVLDTYPDRAIPEGFVEKNWLTLAKNISAYDYFVRGITSKPDIRSKLEVLDAIAPLFELPEIKQEMESPERFCNQSTPLLQTWKDMFNVPAYTSLRNGINLSSNQIRRVRFSFVLRATLAYILYQEVFSVEENAPIWETVERCLNAVFGQSDGAATLQYCRLETVKLDVVKASLESRAQQLAESIYRTLLPLSHWVEDSPNNDKATHLESLEKITRQSIYLATDLQSRQGSFQFLWPKYGVMFDPDLYSVDDSQEDEVLLMNYETKKKQIIAFTLMPIVQRKLPNEERMLPYARGVVLLKVPYVDYRRG